MNIILIGLRQLQMYQFDRLNSSGLNFYVFVSKEEATQADKFKSEFLTVVEVGAETVDGVMYSLAVDEIAEYVKQNNLSDDMAILCADEANTIVAAQLRALFDISTGPHPDQLIFYRDKIAMKQKLVEAGVRVPKFTEVSEIAQLPTNFSEVQQQFGHKVVFKPSSSAGSWKVGIVEDQQQYEAFLSEAAEQLTYDVEEFIEGDFYSCDTLTVDGKIYFCEVCRSVPNIEFQDGKPLYYLIDLQDTDLKKQIKGFTKDVLRGLGYIDGIQHTEVIVNKAGECILVESNARAPGLAITRNYQDIFGENLLEHELALVTKKFDYVRDDSDTIYSTFINFPVKKGTLHQFNFPELESQLEPVTLFNDGDQMPACRSNMDIAASCILKSTSYEQLKKDLNTLYNSDPVEIAEDLSA